MSSSLFVVTINGMKDFDLNTEITRQDLEEVVPGRSRHRSVREPKVSLQDSYGFC